MFRLLSSAVIGLILGIGFIVGSVIVTGDPSLFWNLPSLFIIVGGTCASVIIAFPPKRLKTLFPVIKRAMVREKYDIEDDINVIISLAEKAKREGLLALEDQIDDYTEDEFIKRGVLLIIDGVDEEELRDFLTGDTYFMKQRHQKGAGILGMIAATAPALGLLGTYVGLIPMLTSLEDPTTLGPLMALELVSSFYGAFIAYVVFAPLSKRLKIMSGEEVSRREILIEGIVSIQQGKNPKLIRNKLYAYAHIQPKVEEKSESAVLVNQRG